MNKKQATRIIKKGSHWRDADEEVVITKVTRNGVSYKTSTGFGIADEWYFRENFIPGRLPKKKATP